MNSRLLGHGIRTDAEIEAMVIADLRKALIEALRVETEKEDQAFLYGTGHKGVIPHGVLRATGKPRKAGLK